jgi:DNA-binding NtrC family response regulator
MQLIDLRAMVIEDDEDLRGAVARILTDWGAQVAVAGSAAEAADRLAIPPAPDLLIVDVRLSDGSAFGVIDAASQLSPAPRVVAMSGKASPDEAFKLAQSGVCSYLPKPFSIDELASAIEMAREDPHSLKPLIAACVGRVPMRELQREVRRLMVDEALARADGSRSGAARLLHVTRQAVQQIIRGGRTSEARDEQSAPPRQ